MWFFSPDGVYYKVRKHIRAGRRLAEKDDCLRNPHTTSRKPRRLGVDAPTIPAFDLEAPGHVERQAYDLSVNLHGSGVQDIAYADAGPEFRFELLERAESVPFP